VWTITSWHRGYVSGSNTLQVCSGGEQLITSGRFNQREILTPYTSLSRSRFYHLCYLISTILSFIFIQSWLFINSLFVALFIYLFCYTKTRVKLFSCVHSGLFHFECTGQTSTCVGMPLCYDRVWALFWCSRFYQSWKRYFCSEKSGSH